jgi:diketogulonate reductase-like aldo/keto reductase
MRVALCSVCVCIHCRLTGFDIRLEIRALGTIAGMPPATDAPQIAGPHGEQWPALGLGTWRLGEASRDREREVATLRRALEIGYRLVDTAEMYGDGGAERVVGRAIREAIRQGGLVREQLRVVSKAYPHHADTPGLKRACDASRRRLQLESIDLYLLHWRGDVPLAETLDGFHELQRLGWIRYWGVSNFDRTDMVELARLSGAAACAANQVCYSLSERGVEFELLPWMHERGMPLMAYCPIDGGRLAKNLVLAALARSLDMTAAQLALAWLLVQADVMVIPKAGSDRHLLENWECRGKSLSAAMLSQLDALFPAPTRKHPLAMR